MKSFLSLLVFLLPVLCEASTLRKESLEQISNLQQDNEDSKIKIVDFEKKLFKPFDCQKLDTEYLRINDLNDCLIIQELSTEYLVKPHKADPNIWGTPSPELKIAYLGIKNYTQK